MRTRRSSLRPPLSTLPHSLLLSLFPYKKRKLRRRNMWQWWWSRVDSTAWPIVYRVSSFTPNSSGLCRGDPARPSQSPRGYRFHYKVERSRWRRLQSMAQGIEPKNVECLLMRATCHLFLTNNDETIELAKAAHEITKRNPHAILLIAEGYYRKGDFEMALKYFINGKRMRSSIEAFTSGVHKCEQAIKNNCGNDVDPKLWPEMDLTDYYSYAFPPKNTSNSFTLDARKATVGEKGTADKKLTEKWPEMMPAETLRKVFGKKYSEYLYIHEMYRVEGKRAEFLKHMEMSHLDDLCARIDRCKQNRKIVRDCAYCLQAKTDLWHKIDPSMKHTTPL